MSYDFGHTCLQSMESQPKKNAHGGARRGAGRRALLGKRVVLTVRVLPGLLEAIHWKVGWQRGAVSRYVEGTLTKDLNYVPEEG
jgi:hypothetical protein